MRKLYEVDDGGALYWVIAKSEFHALRLVLEQECMDGRHPNEPAPVVKRQCTAQDPRKTFSLDGDEEKCSMWLAYSIAAQFGEGILACSEWP